MQKRVMFIAILLLAICNKIVAAGGTDLISISDFSLYSGGTKEVSVVMTNTDSYVGFQFDLVLPEGITVDSLSASERIPQGTSLQMAQQTDGSYRFIAYAQNRLPITGNDGAIMTLTLKASESVVPNSYTGYLRDVKMSTVDGGGVVIVDQLPFTITVKDIEPYAALTGDSILTFYYDNKKEERNGMGIGPFNYTGYNPQSWEREKTSITTVVFDASFADYHPISTTGWFDGCSALSTITGIENLKTDSVTEMNAMFRSCSSLTSLDLRSFNTQKVTNLNYMFAYCANLTSIDMTSFNTVNVTDMSYMFNDCSKLTTPTFGSTFVVDNVTDMQGMFGKCAALTSLDLSSFNTSKIYTMNSMFQGCTSLKSVDFGHFYTPELGDVGQLFRYCSSLETVDLSGFNTAKVFLFSGMFVDCTALTTVYAGSAWSTEGLNPNNMMYGYSIFDGCTSLVGGQGTVFDADHTDYTYAHIDGGASNPGYFTDINAPSSYTVTLSVSDGGAVTVNHESENENGKTTFTVAPGDSLDFIIIPQDGFQLTSVLVDTLNVISDVRKIEGSESLIYTLQKIYQNHNVHVSFTELGHVAMPTLTWSGDSLIMHCATEEATIQYNDLDKPNPVIVDNEVVYTTVTYTAPIVVTNDINFRIWAIKDGMANSDTLLLNYPYTVWQELLSAIAVAEQAMTAGTGNDNVPGELLTDLNVELTNAKAFYVERIGGETVIRDYADRLRQKADAVMQRATAVDEPYGVLADNNDILEQSDSTVTYGKTMTIYYDKKKIERGGLSLIFNDWRQREYNDSTDLITKVVITPSLVNATTITNTSYWFDGFKNLKEIEGLPNLNTTNVTNMECMFLGCVSLTSLDLSNFNTSRVTNMKNLFTNLWSLTTIDVSGLNTEAAVDMAGLFYGCHSLTSLDLSSFNTTNANDMSFMFFDCPNIKTIDLSSFNTSNVTWMISMFDNASALTTVYAGSGWTTESLSQTPSEMYGSSKGGDYMFRGCRSIKGGLGTAYDENYVDYTYAHIDGGVSNPGYFTDKNAPVIDDNIIQFADAAVKAICVEKWDADGDGELSKAEAAAVTSLNKAFNQNVDIISFEEFRYFTGVTMLVEWEFYNCSNLKKIVLPPHLQSIEDHAFYYCGIDSIVLPASVTNITDAGMYGCFKNIDVDADNPMFCSIDGVLFSKDATVIRNYPVRRYDESYTVPSTVTAIGGCAFYGSRLREIVVPDGVTRFEAGAFRYCRELENIVIPATVDSIFNENFQYCDALTSVMIPANVKYMADDVLSVCSNLKEILVDVDNQNYRSLDGVLYDKDVTRLRIYPANYQTESYVVPDDVTSMYLFAFNRAKNIQAITLPQSLTNISRFDDSKNLTSVTVHWQEPLTLGANTDYFHENTLTNGTLYVPYGTKSLYEQTEGWNKFQNIVEMEAPAVNATFDNHGVLTVGGTATMTEALETVGGVSVVAETITAIVWNSTATLTNSDLQGLDNPNMLVYVPSESQAPVNRNNVIIGNDSTGYTAKNIVLTDVAQGNNNFYCPIAFTAERISYTREFKQQTQVDVCRGWETIALPFAVQTVTHERNGVIAPFGNSASGKHFWLRQLTQSGLQPATTIEANMPYLISMPNNTDLYAADFNQGGRVTFTAENTAVPVTTQHVTALADSTILFVPTTMQVGRSSDVWALNVGQVRGANLEGSVFERDFREVRPFEAYTVHRSNTPAPRFVPINDINGGNLTGISDASLVNSEKVNNEKWYDLNGRQLQQKPTKGGVYILNGKKVVLR